MTAAAHRHHLTDNQQKKLLARYREAHAAFGRGQLRVALRRYQALSADLAPHFARIAGRNIGSPLEAHADLSGDQANELLAGLTKDTIERLRPGSREGRTAALCSAVAHDCALIARHLAEGTERGRDPEVADAIVRGFAHAIAVDPRNPINHHNLAGWLDYLGRDAEAGEQYRAALQLNQHQWESWVSWGHSCGRLGDRESAEQCWQNAFKVTDADDAQRGPQRRWGMAMLRLLKGEYIRGWDDYEARLTFPPYVERHGRPDLTAPRWDGAEMSGTLYLHGEQGAGDQIMTARYIPIVRSRVGRIVIEVVRSMIPLFEVMFPGVELVAKGDVAPPHDAQLPMFSLPYICGAALENIPDPVPFPVCSAENVPIQPEPGRIGLCWRGSATHPNDLIRSMPFEATFPLLDLPGLAWQSLQFGYETSPPLDPMPVGDFLDTARQIARCSLIITVDTSIAHLAGVMGVPVWILLPFSAEWRWLQDRDDSPWYPSARLWRQSTAGDWRGLVGRVATELATR